MKGNRQLRELPPSVSASAFKSSAWPTIEKPSEEAREAPMPYAENVDIVLPLDFRPTKYDVINGRGKKSYNHIANRRFRQLTAMNMRRYKNAKNKTDKSFIVIGIVNSVRKTSPSGGFIKKCPTTGRWISMSNEGAREKVGHCLRDMIISAKEQQSKEQLIAQPSRQGSFKASQKEIRLKPTTTTNTPTILTKLAHTTTFNRRVLPIVKSQKKPAKKPSKVAAAVAVAVASHPPLHAPLHVPLRAPLHTSVHPPLHAPLHASLLPARKKSRDPPANFGPDEMDPSEAPRTFNNFDQTSTAKESSQDMSQQQRNILKLLEGGWKGSIEDLLELAG